MTPKASKLASHVCNQPPETLYWNHPPLSVFQASSRVHHMKKCRICFHFQAAAAKPPPPPKAIVDLIELKGSAATKHPKSHMAGIMHEMFRTSNANGSESE